MSTDEAFGLAFDLELLRGEWARAVKCQEHNGILRPRACFFRGLPEAGDCDGWIEGAHWIKRQRVEKVLCAAFDLPEAVLKGRKPLVDELYGHDYTERRELVLQAAWDPRNGVAGCGKHHRAFDLGSLVVWRQHVPEHVESFCADHGLETALTDRNPPMNEGI